MVMEAKQPKDVVRLQFDVKRAHLNIIESLVDACGLSSKKDLFSNAMALMKWAVQETKKGRRIASYDPERDEIEVVALPALDMIEQPADRVWRTDDDKKAVNANEGGSRFVGKKPKLDLV